MTISFNRIKTNQLYILIVFVFCTFLIVSCDIGYKNDGKVVTYHSWNESSGHSVWKLDANPATFENLGDGYAHDDKHAFLDGHMIDSADGKTFKSLGHGYAIDANHVFHLSQIMDSVDIKTFKVHSQYLTEDKNDYYWNTLPIHVADKSTFVILGNNGAWDTNWAKDKKYGYYMGQSRVAIADYKSFHPIKTMIISSVYAADKYHVYYEDRIVKGADPKTFFEAAWGIGQDAKRVYYKSEATSIKDYKSLKKLNSYFYTDGKYLYSEELVRLEYADLNTFRKLDIKDCFADKNNVWWHGKLVKGIDVATIKPIHPICYINGEIIATNYSCEWLKDKNHVFYKDSMIPDADPNTFKVVYLGRAGRIAAFDQKHVYQCEDSIAFKEYLEIRP